jgi:hypothetical protein
MIRVCQRPLFTGKARTIMIIKTKAAAYISPKI